MNTSTKDKAYFAHCEKCWHLKPEIICLEGFARNRACMHLGFLGSYVCMA